MKRIRSFVFAGVVTEALALFTGMAYAEDLSGVIVKGSFSQKTLASLET